MQQVLRTFLEAESCTLFLAAGVKPDKPTVQQVEKAVRLKLIILIRVADKEPSQSQRETATFSLRRGEHHRRSTIMSISSWHRLELEGRNLK